MSNGWQSGIRYAEISDVGMRRSNNQDSAACLPAGSQERFADRGHLFVVADGMGAHAAGELASRMATEKIALNYFRTSSEPPTGALLQAIDQANTDIHRRGQENPEFHNMGTTASTLVIAPEGALVGHVGDSRVYRLRRGSLEQLTFDHSLVWEMQASGQIGSEGIVGIPKNVITRSLGPNAHVEIDIEGPFGVADGDRFLVCSDGLTGQVEDEEIAALLDCLSVDQAVRVLVDLANLRGGPDNITAIVVHVDRSPSGTAPKRVTAPTPTTAAILAIVAGCCFVAAAGLAALSMFGPMVVAVVLGLIAATVGFFSRRPAGEPGNRIPSSGGGHGRGPYRHYPAKPTRDLYERLGQTVRDLRAAAETNRWPMDWSDVDRHQTDGQTALDGKNAKTAIRHQAEAIIETMNQLRKQNDREAGETAIDY